MAYDVERIRADVPALDSGIAFFDSPGGTQFPRPVIEAMAAAMANPLSNREPTTTGGINADRITAHARQAIADLVGAGPEQVVFGRSATDLTFILARALSQADPSGRASAHRQAGASGRTGSSSAGWGSGDEIVVTRLDHDANVRPWVLAAERAGATVRWCDFDPSTGELTVDDLRAVLSERTRLVALPGASNLIGTIPDHAALIALARTTGAHVHVDAVHLAAHRSIDFDTLGADSLTCSPYKFCGPHLGAVVARSDILADMWVDKLLPATNDIPERFEFGTLPYELLAGVSAAVDWLAGLDDTATGTRRERLLAGFAAAEEHEHALGTAFTAAIAELPDVFRHSRAADRTPTALLTFAGQDSAEIAETLAENDIQATAGEFYAWEPAQRMGLPNGGLRVGMAPYNTIEEVERLVAVIARLL